MPTPPAPSLVITRNFGNASDCLQTYVPSRFLRGLIPDCLLYDYTFWQNTDDSLVGYQKPEIQARTQTAYLKNLVETILFD